MTQEPLTVSSILSQLIWYNYYTKIGNGVLTKRFDKELFVADLYNRNQLLNWQDFKTKFGLKNNDHFRWIQIMNAIPITWRRIVENGQITSHPLRVQHILMLTRQIPLEALTSKYIYTLKIMKIKGSPTSQEYIINKI